MTKTSCHRLINNSTDALIQFDKIETAVRIMHEVVPVHQGQSGLLFSDRQIYEETYLHLRGYMQEQNKQKLSVW